MPVRPCGLVQVIVGLRLAKPDNATFVGAGAFATFSIEFVVAVTVGGVAVSLLKVTVHGPVRSGLRLICRLKSLGFAVTGLNGIVIPPRGCCVVGGYSGRPVNRLVVCAVPVVPAYPFGVTVAESSIRGLG